MMTYDEQLTGDPIVVAQHLAERAAEAIQAADVAIRECAAAEARARLHPDDAKIIVAAQGARRRAIEAFKFGRIATEQWAAAAGRAGLIDEQAFLSAQREADEAALASVPTADIIPMRSVDDEGQS
jgi:hypothetical protein